MKSYTAIAAALAVALESASAMQIYLEYIPNGSLFSQELGHPDNDSSQLTTFATNFDNADLTWSTTFCQATFPGSSMTNGEAFGDPCCTWTKGGTPDFTVTPFTTSPTKATTCATSSSTTSSTTSSTAASTTSSSTGSTSTATTPSTASTEASTEASSDTDESESSEDSDSSSTTATTAPATTTAAPTVTTAAPSSGCKARRY